MRWFRCAMSVATSPSAFKMRGATVASTGATTLVLCQLENMMSNPNASLRLSYFHPHLHIMLEPRAAHVQLPGKP